MKITHLLSYLLFFIAAGFVSAAPLPDTFPTTLSQARNYAVAHAATVSRTITQNDGGRVKVNGSTENSQVRLAVEQPSNGEKIISAVQGDIMSVSFTKGGVSFNLEHRVVDSAGQTLLQSLTYAELVKTWNSPEIWDLPTWFKSGKNVNFYLSEFVYVQIDADYCYAEFVSPDGQHAGTEYLPPYQAGGKTYIKIPTAWYRSPAWINGYITVHGKNKAGQFIAKQYTNATGSSEGITALNIRPLVGISDHYVIQAGEHVAADIARMVIPSWHNNIEDPSFEWTPKSSKGLSINMITSDGVMPLKAVVTHVLNGVEQTKAYDWSAMEKYGAEFWIRGEVGITYFVRFVWPDFVTLNQSRG